MNDLHTGEKVSMQDSKTWKPAVVMKTSKFKWMLNNIRIEKIISAQIWVTNFFF